MILSIVPFCLELKDLSFYLTSTGTPRTGQDNEIKQPKVDTRRVDWEQPLFCSKIRGMGKNAKENNTSDQSLALSC